MKTLEEILNDRICEFQKYVSELQARPFSVNSTKMIMSVEDKIQLLHGCLEEYKNQI
jgi:hypothetical protein